MIILVMAAAPLRSSPAAILVAAAISAGVLAWLLIAGGPASAFAGAGNPGSAEPAAKSVPTPKRAKLTLKNSSFGPVIYERRSGLVAYLFTKDRKRKSKCYGACAKAWPPIKTRKRPAVAGGLKAKHVGTSRRRGGGRIVTYRGRPLYFYEHDSPGRIGCNDVFQFGGDWFVVNAAGKPPA